MLHYNPYTSIVKGVIRGYYGVDPAGLLLFSPTIWEYLILFRIKSTFPTPFFSPKFHYLSEKLHYYTPKPNICSCFGHENNLHSAGLTGHRCVFERPPCGAKRPPQNVSLTAFYHNRVVFSSPLHYRISRYFIIHDHGFPILRSSLGAYDRASLILCSSFE